jgi:hypothetical protein
VILLQAAVTLLLLALCGFAPGFYLVRRLPWNPMEKLCGAIGASLILLWLAAWGAYLLVPGGERVAYIGISAICAVLGLASLRDARKLVAVSRVRRTLVGFGFLVAWTLLILAIIRNYSGAQWSGDWLEHFQRSLFFLHHFPTNVEIFGKYQLPARPPALNVLAAFFLGQVQDRFELFQLIFSTLNLIVFFPCCLIVPMLSKSRRTGILALVCIFATSPIIIQNATYTWTKLLAAFFVILAIPFYLRGWRKNDPVRTVFAFLCLAEGLLVHYSAGPYCVFFALHYLIATFPKRPGRWKELAIISASCGLLLATWLGWSAATYGAGATIASNTSVTAGRENQGHNLEKAALNALDSVVPHLLRGPALIQSLHHPNQMATLRDNIFVFYQANLIFSMGLIGGPLVIWFVVAAFRRRERGSKENVFWIWLIVSAVVVGIGVVGERDPMGVAHLTLLPMEALGLTLLASRFLTKPVIAWLMIVGCGIDFSLGVFLHARVQHLENTPEKTVFTGLSFSNGRFAVGPVGTDAMSMPAWGNWMRKHQYRLMEQWDRDAGNYRRDDAALDRARADFRKGLDLLKQQDGRMWGGWYRRNGGEITFIGDDFGDGDAVSALLFLAGLGLLWKMAKTAPRDRRPEMAPIAKSPAFPRNRRRSR